MIGTAWPRTTVARWAGGLYLAYVLANVLASRLGHIGLSDADTLRAAITDDEMLFRLGLVAAISSALLFVLTAWALYVLLRPVNEPLALLLLILNAIGVAVQCASYLPLFTVLAQSDSVGLTGPQLDALAMLSVTTHQTGFIIAQVFFSAWLFPLGWLVLRSGFLPRFLGWLLLAGRRRGPRLVPPGTPRTRIPSHQLPLLGDRLHRRGQPRAMAPHQGRTCRGTHELTRQRPSPAASRPAAKSMPMPRPQCVGWVISGATVQATGWLDIDGGTGAGVPHLPQEAGVPRPADQ